MLEDTIIVEDFNNKTGILDIESKKEIVAMSYDFIGRLKGNDGEVINDDLVIVHQNYGEKDKLMTGTAYYGYEQKMRINGCY